LVPCGDAAAVADAVTKLLDDPDYANRLATNGQSSALEKFTSTRYRAEIVAEVSVLAGRQVRT
jgi:glycosyltransferase involved in cell wall biosynthesis